MRKQTRQYLRRILCGVLSAAMILTGSAISGMTVYASQPDVENEGGGLTDDVDDSKDTSQNPAGDAVTDDENGTGGDGSNQEGAEDGTQPGDDTSQPGDGEGNSGSDENGDLEDLDEEDSENDDLEDSDAEAGDEDVKDPDAEDEAEEDDKTVIKKDDEEVRALKSARAGGEKQFYYYCEPDTDEAVSLELGVELWANDGGSISTGAAAAEWNSDYYLMTPVTNFSGWYSIGLTITDEITETDGSASSKAGFKIHKKVSNKDTVDMIAEFDAWNNKELYAELLGENIESYAVKDWKGYAKTNDSDMVTAIMRQVTLHIYDEAGIPSIAVKEGGLSYVDIDGTLKDCTVSKEETWAKRYDFAEDTEGSNWYNLTFVVPEQFKSGETVDNIQLYTKSKTDGSYTWKFNFSDESGSNGVVDCSPVFEGKVYYKEGDFYKTMEEAEGITLGQLNALLASDELQKIINKGETGYTAETWAVFSTALSTAQNLSNSNSGQSENYTSEEIKEAYNGLQEAMKALVSLSADVTLYYYAGDTEDEIGLYGWDDSAGKQNLTSTADHADWKVWNDNDTYRMTAVDGYAGWYSIPLSFMNGGADAGFEIYTKTAGTAEKKTPLYKCDAGEGNNPEIYGKLTSGDNDTFAIKGSAGYEGADKTAQIMRNVTFYVYNEEILPAIQLDDKSAAKELSVVNEEDGSITKLTPSGQDSSNNNVYELQPVADHENWYSLAFSAPGSIDLDNSKIGGFYGKIDGNYTWLKDLKNGSAGDTWGVGFGPVFAGENYCKYEHGSTDEERKLSFYASMEEAETKTLGQLKAFLASDELKKITDKGETGYTADTWTVFSTALAAAQKTASDNSAQPDTFKSDAITKAYKDLQSAMKALISLGADVTLYYYTGSTEDEIGLYYWDNSTDKQNLTSTASKADWNVWNAGDTYLMTAVDGYAGWYSIPLSFRNGGADAGFGIYTKTAGTAAEKTPLYKCDASEGNNPEIYEKLVSGENDVFAIKGGIGYEGAGKTAQIMRNVTLHVYGAYGVPHLQMGKATASSLSVVDEKTGTVTALEAVTVEEQNAYALTEEEEYRNWYSITFSAPGKLVFDGTEKVCNLYQVDEKANLAWAKDWMNGPASESWTADFTPVFAGNTYYKDGVFYATIEEADPDGMMTPLERLQKLVDEAKKLQKDDYKDDGWDAFQTALTAAEAVLQAAADALVDNAKPAPTDEEIKKVYEDLVAAMDALIPASIQETLINVKKIALTDDFITGADLSSYLALKESGTVFKDEDDKPLSDAAFFRYLRDGGTNWVRIRIWNNPYDSSGRGYGGGNNDLEKAKIMGKLATDAGMKVLIDFHYSDFWADPAKQQAPKAWKTLSLAEKENAVESYTLDSLNALRGAGVNVGMVQVGNETNNAICGENSRENMAKIFNAGSRAVRTFDPNCLVALHFTNPEKGGYYEGWAADLDKYKVDYDVFASSYYPFWHGTTSNLEDVLEQVAEKYGKKVMVAETSWTTSWEDGDGHENTAPRTSQDLDYDISLQGQADEVRDVVNAVNNINSSQPGKAIGVFYWEPAWISPYNVYDEDGNADEKLVKQNQEAWEKYGSGWASSYASEYDPEDAGKWYGGSAVDNQSWFDFNGKALPTAKIYSLIRTGATAERDISSIGFAKDENPLEVLLGTEITYPKAVATFNDGTTELKEVTWDKEEQELVNTDKVGEYVVHGTVTEKGKVYKLTLTVKVMRTSFSNILVNPGFEQDGTAHTGWEVTGQGISTNENDWKQNVRSGVYAMHFWWEAPTTLGTYQIVEHPEAGIYTFGGYIQGDGADTEDVHYAYAEVYDKDNKLKSRKQVSFTLSGWMNWSEPEVTDIAVEEGDSLKVGVEIHASKVGTSGIWGTMDDFYLCGTHDVTVAEGIEHGSVETSVVKANSGEKVVVTVTPDEGYYLDTMTLSGASITAENCADIFTSANGTVAFRAAAEGTTNAAVLTYSAETAEAKADTFTMPNGNVVVGATFKSVFGESTDKIALDAKDETGKYLVQVKADGAINTDPAGEKPVPEQFHTGKNVTPAVELSYKGYKLTTADYTVTYANNKNITTSESQAKITLTAKGDRFTGTREILFDIKEDTRKEFSAKKLKVVFDNPDKGGIRTDKASQAIYYLGKEKEIEPKISLYGIADDITDTTKAISSDLYKVYYQNNKKIGKATLVVLPTDQALNDPNGYREGSVTANFTIAKCPVNQGNIFVTVNAAANYYTGKKVEPSVTVRYEYTEQNGNKKTVTLAKGTDYTIACTNNVNANVYKVLEKQEDGTEVEKYIPINPNKVSTVKITGKGNFTGTRTTVGLVGPNNKPGTDKFTFAIRPRDLGGLDEEAITVADLAEKTSAQSLKITVKDGTKKVAASQYEITEIERTHDAEGKPLETAQTVYSKSDGSGTAKVKEAGTYKVTIAGKAKSNYEGDVKKTFHVVDKDHLISNAKITVTGKFYYTGDPILLSTKSTQEGVKPELEVKAGSGSKAVVLVEQSSKNAEKDGYYVEYMDRSNINAGKAVIRIIGTGSYAGTKTATFTINKRALMISGDTVSENEKNKRSTFAYVKLSRKNIEAKQDGTWEPLEADSGLLINTDTTGKTEYGSLAIPYTGYELSPELKFNFMNCDTEKIKELPSSDYTVSYKIGKWENGAAPVTATVKGRGNYSGSVKIPELFTVTARKLDELSIDVSPVTYNGKALKPAVIFRDKVTGKVVDLKLNTAYSVSYKNNKDIFGVSRKQPVLTVKVKGKGWASDSEKSRELNFTINQAEIIKTDVEDVVFQTFKNKTLKPKVTIKVNGRKLKEGKDYELTYDKNIKRSGTNTATVTIKGKGNYFTRKPIEKIFVIK